jgi:cytochrome c biogenesis protein CcmG, thiol:disulfide interchange protein DsbE
MSVKSWIRLALVTVIVSGVIGLLAYGFSRDARHISSPLVGTQAPSFTLTLFDGKTIRLEDLRGKVVFLNFWASWCVPCRAEAKALEAGWNKYKDRGIVFLGVNIQDKEKDARDFIQEFGITYMNGIDKAGKIGIDYGVWGIPETFFIDHAGRITYKHVGGIDTQTIIAKLDQASLGIISAEEGKGEYRSIR